MSLHNVDLKLISKVLANIMKNLLKNSILCDQNAYAIKKIVSKRCRSISEILDITNVLKEKGCLLTIDTEKSFDFVNHYFLLAILENYGFLKTF